MRSPTLAVAAVTVAAALLLTAAAGAALVLAGASREGLESGLYVLGFGIALPASFALALNRAPGVAPRSARVAFAPSRRARNQRRLVVDIAVVALTVLAVSNLGYGDFTFEYHMNHYAGPVLDVVRGGGAVLVDTFSLYGVAVIYFLAALFWVIPLTEGSFLVVTSLLTALSLLGMYVTLRLSIRSQTLALTALAVAVAIHVPYALLTANTSGLRFGLPQLVVLFGVVSTRSTRGRLFFPWGAALVGAVSAVWSVETLVYSTAAFAAMAALDAALSARPLRRLAASVSVLLAAGAAAILLLTTATRFAAGHWPNWDSYLEQVRFYAVDGFGKLPLDPWSLALVPPLVYACSAALLAALAAIQPDEVRRMAPAAMAIAGFTGFGIAVYSYFVGRSHPINLHNVAVPAVAVVALWVAVARPWLSVRTAAVLTATAVGVGLTVGVASTAPTDVLRTRSALAAVLGHAPAGSLRDQARLLRASPPSTPEIAEATELLARFAPSGTPVLVLVEPQATTSILLQAQAANPLGLSEPSQAFLTPRATEQVLRRIEKLEPGTTVVTRREYLQASSEGMPQLEQARDRLDLRREQTVYDAARAGSEAVLASVRARFRLRQLTSTPTGLVVARIEAKA